MKTPLDTPAIEGHGLARGNLFHVFAQGLRIGHVSPNQELREGGLSQPQLDGPRPQRTELGSKYDGLAFLVDEERLLADAVTSQQ